MNKDYFLQSGLTPLIHLHRHSHLANRSLDFINKEEKELFVINLRKYPQSETLNTYREHPISYVHNNLGFRSYENFQEGDEGNLFLGCSHTFGESLYLEDTWGYKVNKQIGGKFLNLGIPGTSMETGARLLLTYLKYFKVRNVFVYYPHIYRYEFLSDETEKLGKHWITILPHTHEPEENWPGVNFTLRSSLLNDDVAVSRYLSSFYSIVGICNTKKIPLYFTELNDSQKFINPASRKARDLTHYSTSTHDFLATRALERYELKVLPDISHTSVEYSHVIRDIHSKSKFI